MLYHHAPTPKCYKTVVTLNNKGINAQIFFRIPSVQALTRISTRRVHNLAGKLTPCSDAWAIEDKNPRHYSQQRADATKQTARGAIAETIIHLCCDEREYAA